MDQAYLHFIFNHFPILGTLFGITLLIVGMIRKDRSLENAALITFIVMALLTIPAFLTGEAAEDMAEKIEGISEHYIHEHEELAEKGLWQMMALGTVALITLIMIILKRKSAGFLKIITLLISVGTFILMVLIGNSGGEIRHSEIRKEGREAGK